MPKVLCRRRNHVHKLYPVSRKEVYEGGQCICEVRQTRVFRDEPKYAYILQRELSGLTGNSLEFVVQAQ